MSRTFVSNTRRILHAVLHNRQFLFIRVASTMHGKKDATEVAEQAIVPAKLMKGLLTWSI